MSITVILNGYLVKWCDVVSMRPVNAFGICVSAWQYIHTENGIIKVEMLLWASMDIRAVQMHEMGAGTESIVTYENLFSEPYNQNCLSIAEAG